MTEKSQRMKDASDSGSDNSSVVGAYLIHLAVNLRVEIRKKGD